MKTLIKHTLTMVALFVGAFTAQAQVKIGSNPTVIEAQSNLEVEASTPNRKVKVDKTSGQVTIQDGTEGTGKVLTSDAVGGASWQLIGAANMAQLPKGKLSGALTNELITGVIQEVQWGTNNFFETGMVRSGSGIKVPVSGYYLVQCNLTVKNFPGCTGYSSGSFAQVIKVNGVQTGASADDKTGPLISDNFGIVVSTMMYLNANDVVAVDAFQNHNSGSGGCVSAVVGGELVVAYHP